MNELIIQSDPKSSMSEAIRTLRTNLQFSSVDKKIITILDCAVARTICFIYYKVFYILSQVIKEQNLLLQYVTWH